MPRKKIPEPVSRVYVEDRLDGFADNDLVPDSVTRQIFGVTYMTLYRWERKPELNFPAASVVERRKYRRVGELRKFRRQHYGF